MRGAADLEFLHLKFLQRFAAGTSNAGAVWNHGFVTLSIDVDTGSRKENASRQEFKVRF